MATGEDFHLKESYLQNKKITFDILDKLGYSKTLFEKRIQMYKIISECSTVIINRHRDTSISAIVAGSRGEGICTSCDSDADMLFIQQMVKCTENFNSDETVPVIFQLDFENIPSGYSKLRLVSLDNGHHDVDFLAKVKDNLVQRNGQTYLSNDKSLVTVVGQGLVKQHSVFDDISGPARTLRVEMPTIPELHIFADYVIAFKCEYPSVVDNWCERERKYSWPGKDLIERVKRLDVLVVPAGCKGSMEEELQWRISLTLAEQALVHSFNDVQIKLYAALKMLAKHELKPICDNITSYIVKNLLFWTFENTEINTITKDMFDVILERILEHLKMCITWQCLPNYMMPSKNMLQYKIFEKEKTELLRRISLILHDGNNILFRCPLVKEITYLSFKEIEEMIVFKDILEQTTLAVFFISATNAELTEKIWDNERNPLDVLNTIVDDIFPIIWRNNPMGLFDRLKTMSKEAFLYCLVNGIARGYHKSPH